MKPSSISKLSSPSNKFSGLDYADVAHITKQSSATSKYAPSPSLSIGLKESSFSNHNMLIQDNKIFIKPAIRKI